MPLLDTLASGAKGLGSGVLETLNQPNVRNTLGLMALAVPAAFAAKSLSKRRDRAGAVGNVAQLFGNLALKELYRPREEREKLTNLMAQMGELSLRPPTPGAEPHTTYAGTPLYQAGTLAQKHPGIFSPTQPLPAGMAGPPEPQEVSPLMQALGGIPSTPKTQAAFLEVLSDQEARKRESERRASTMQALLHLHQGGKGGDFVAVPGMDAKGYPTLKLQQPRGVSAVERVLGPEGAKEYYESRLKGTPREADTIINLENQGRQAKGLPPMTPGEEASARKELRRMGVEAQGQRMQGELISREIAQTEDELRPFMPLIEKSGGNPLSIDPESEDAYSVFSEHGRRTGITSPSALDAALRRLSRLRQELQSFGEGGQATAPPSPVRPSSGRNLTPEETERRTQDYLRSKGYIQ